MVRRIRWREGLRRKKHWVPEDVRIRRRKQAAMGRSQKVHQESYW